METTVLPPKIEPEMERVLRHILDGALGTIIVLEAAPTTAGREITDGQIGYFSNTLYININGTTYSVGLIPT